MYKKNFFKTNMPVAKSNSENYFMTQLHCLPGKKKIFVFGKEKVFPEWFENILFIVVPCNGEHFETRFSNGFSLKEVQNAAVLSTYV